jgi:uroporphyrinogen-III synthase
LFVRIHTVLDTRPATARNFSAILEDAGISVLHVPLIRIERVAMDERITDVLRRLPSFDGVLLTSMNAVRCFAALLREAAIAVELLPPVFVVGPKTAELAREEGFAPQALPSSSYGVTMAAELPDVRDRRFLQPCADIAREETAEGIRARGGEIEQLTVYRTLPPTDTDAARLLESARQAAYDCAAFFSPSAVRHYAAILPEAERPAAVIAAIGDTTAAEAESCGLCVDILPAEQTAEALAEAIARWEKD